MEGKKYFELTPADLLEHPVWVLAMDVATYSDAEEEEDWDDDTSLVVPLPDDPALVERLFDSCICYARARFRDARGRAFLGMVKCRAGDTVQNTHPTIVTDSGRVRFYYGIAKPTAEQVAAHYEHLGASPEELFPLTYQPDASIPDGPSGGVLEGFYYMVIKGSDQGIKFTR